MEGASLRNLRLNAQYQIYGSEGVSVVDAFYNPVLETARRYDRLSGFFTSQSLALAAQGMAAIIANGGKMRLVCSPNLSALDADALRSLDSGCTDELAESYFGKCFHLTEDEIREHHVEALAWMLREGFLEIRLAVVTDDSGRILPNALFHPKVGIVVDVNGDAISFSGSNNETASGWTGNQEEFKVFKSWESGQVRFYESDRRSFDAYWEGGVDHVKCFDLPSAFRKRLIRVCETFAKEDYIRKQYLERQTRVKAWKHLSLFRYQQDAIAKWCANGRRLMFEMATGSGKTRCAIGCVNKLIESVGNRPICAVVAMPTNDLCGQWEKELRDAIVEPYKLVVANSRGGNGAWRKSLSRAYAMFSMGTYSCRVLIVITTHATASGKDFISLIEELSAVATLMLVGDEVHGMGASIHKTGLLGCYEARLGLSATPERMFDEGGTAYLREYFGGDKYVFSLKDALAHDRVCPYNYHPIIVSLDDDERDRYDRLSERIRKLSGPASTDADAEERLKSLLIERAQIIAAAKAKIPALRDLIAREARSWGSHILAFACPRNFDECLYCFSHAGVVTSPFTCEQPNRSEVLRKFAAGEFKALLAMKCLDEGIDVPNAHVAVLVSSSTNPREYIQRIGRVIRKAPGKRLAYVYDFLVAPAGPNDEVILRDYDRARYIAEAAQNAYEATTDLFPKFK